MRLYLQFGHGMMDHTATLLEEWGDGGVLLSPRDLDDAKLTRMAKRLTNSAAEVLLDPQCFVRDADHSRLTEHDYWKVYKNCSTGSIVSGDGAARLITSLAELNERLGTARFVVPGLLAPEVTSEWCAFHEQLVNKAASQFPKLSLIATLALSSAAVMDEAQMEALIERVSTWPVGAFYVVPEAPSSYLVDDPAWIANVLILTSGLKLLGREVLVGYGNHQLLILAAAGVDGMASGTWLNVRAFPVDKFYTPEDKVSRRALWYYCPQALSEYKIPFLDIAQRNGVLNLMRPDPPSSYAEPLFTGVAPTSVKWGEQNAFRHYLTCLHQQAQLVTATSFDSALAAQEQLLAGAEKLLSRLRKAGVVNSERDFLPIIDGQRGALATLDHARGRRLRHHWPT
jgi:hypothetical protein